jgi:transposase
MTSKASRRSHLMGEQSVEAGTIRPCESVAARRCPNCGRVLCNNHSRTLSTMDGNLANGRKHRCAGCGTIADRDEWLGVSR